MEDLEDHSATDAPSVEVYSTLMKKSWKNITFLITNFGKITPSLLLKAVFISYHIFSMPTKNLSMIVILF